VVGFIFLSRKQRDRNISLKRYLLYQQPNRKKLLKNHTVKWTLVSLPKINISVEKIIKTFRVISMLEAISFLVLLLVAMPLKYVWEMPEMVRIVGMAHGVLFLLYIAGAVYVSQLLNWSTKTLAIVVLCSILPFGPFYAEKKYL
jgi:integral membrane protein